MHQTRCDRERYARRSNQARVIAALDGVASELGIPAARVALAWLLQKPAVIAPIVGVSKAGQFEDALAALDVQLSAETVARLEDPYRPHPVAGI